MLGRIHLLARVLALIQAPKGRQLQCCHPWDVMELEAIEFNFHFADLPTVGVHRLLGALPVLIYLLYDDFVVAEGEQALDAKPDGDPETMYDSLVLGSVVSSLEE